jgi:hypothetical protein
MEMAMLAVTVTVTEKATADLAHGGMRRLMRRILPAILVLAAPLPIASIAAAETSVGQSAVVVRDVQGTLQENVRKLAKADPVFQNELVATADRSASEIRFLDETSLTVGPGSSIVLDSFLYDPTVPSGTLVIGAAEGVFRFVSGNMPSDSYDIRTPEVTVGVRGTVIDFVATKGATAVVLQSAGSQAVLTSKTGKTVTLDRPGQAAVAFADGSLTPPGPPPVWALWKIREMRSLVASVNPWTPTPRNRPAVDLTDPASGDDGSGNDASYADNGFPLGDGGAPGGPTMIIVK